MTIQRNQQKKNPLNSFLLFYTGGYHFDKKKISRA